MARRSTVGSLDQDYSIEEDTRRGIERRILSDPNLRRDWDFSELETNYPIRPVLSLQREREARLAEEDAAYKTSLLKQREADIALRESDLNLGVFESQMNRRQAALDQIPIVKEKLAGLDPRDPDFISKLVDLETDHPIAFENEQFVKSIINPLVKRNERISSIRNSRRLTLEDAMKANKQIQEIMADKEKRIVPELTEDEKFLLGQLGGVLDSYKSQQGYAPESELPSTGISSSPQGEDEDIIAARNILARRPELKDEINRRLISAGKSPIE